MILKQCLIVVLLAGLGACTAGSDDGAPPDPSTASGTATPPYSADAPTAELHPDSAALVLDVRTPAEFAEGHVSGAVLIPHDEIAERWQEIAAYRDQPVVVYCRSGRRSELAIDVLREKGFTNLRNAGGLDDMLRAGATLER